MRTGVGLLVRLALVTGVVAFLAGCGGDGTGPDGKPTPTPSVAVTPSPSVEPTPTAEPTPTLGLAKVTVGAEGGSLSAQNGRVRLEVPAGAVSAETELTVTPLTEYPADEGIVPGSVFSFSPDGQAFAQPVRLTIGYGEDDRPENVGETTLRLVKLQDDDTWEEVEGGTIDTTKNEGTALINGFSTYAVRGIHVRANRVLLQDSALKCPVGDRVAIEAVILPATQSPAGETYFFCRTTGTHGTLSYFERGQFHTGNDWCGVLEGEHIICWYVANDDAQEGDTDDVRIEAHQANIGYIGAAITKVTIGPPGVCITPWPCAQVDLVEGDTYVSLHAKLPGYEYTHEEIYCWETTGKYGHLTSKDGQTGKELELSYADKGFDVIYNLDRERDEVVDGWQDEVSVKVYHQNGGQRTLIGEASTYVDLYNPTTRYSFCGDAEGTTSAHWGKGSGSFYWDTYLVDHRPLEGEGWPARGGDWVRLVLHGGGAGHDVVIGPIYLRTGRVGDPPTDSMPIVSGEMTIAGKGEYGDVILDEYVEVPSSGLFPETPKWDLLSSIPDYPEWLPILTDWWELWQSHLND